MFHLILSHTPVGPLCLVEKKESLIALTFGDECIYPASQPASTSLLLETVQQLKEYFEGLRRSFTIPLSPEGTPFQQRVWEQLLRIPYGETRSYGQVALMVGSPKAVRAVGMANHRNPISILIPCHRVIGAKGALTGYGGGLEKKQWLLELEQQNTTR